MADIDIPKMALVYEKLSYINKNTYHSNYKPHIDKVLEWSSAQNVEWTSKNKVISDKEVLVINSELKLTIPLPSKNLIPVFEEAKYILELEEGWDDEDAQPYSIDSWRAGANFLLQFYDWLHVNAKGTVHNPKMHHGPKGTIDLAWHEDNIRLFINIDKENNKGTFYCDIPTEPKKQYSEGQFSLNNFKFHLIPIPYKF